MCAGLTYRLQAAKMFHQPGPSPCSPASNPPQVQPRTTCPKSSFHKEHRIVWKAIPIGERVQPKKSSTLLASTIVLMLHSDGHQMHHWYHCPNRQSLHGMAVVHRWYRPSGQPVSGMALLQFNGTIMDLVFSMQRPFTILGSL